MSSAHPGPVHVVGAGPGVGAAVARRFARAGHPAGLVARDPARLAALTLDLTAEGVATESYPADASDPADLARALAVLAERQGPAEVLCFGPPQGAALSESVLDTGAAELEQALALHAVGAAAAVQAVLPGMRAAGRGALLFVTDGTAEHPDPGRAPSEVAGAALRTYTALLSRDLAGSPLRAVHLMVVRRVEPARIADRLWQLHDAGGQGHTVLEQ